MLIATDAPGISVMSPTYAQLVHRGSFFHIRSVALLVWLLLPASVPFPVSTASSYHSTTASGATRWVLGFSLRWNSLPKAVILKYSCLGLWDTSLVNLLWWLAERMLEMKLPSAPVLIGVTSPYSLGLIFGKSVQKTNTQKNQNWNESIRTSLKNGEQIRSYRIGNHQNNDAQRNSLTAVSWTHPLYVSIADSSQPWLVLCSRHQKTKEI